MYLFNRIIWIRKTTIANLLKTQLYTYTRQHIILDGDEIRQTINYDLGLFNSDQLM